MFATLMESHGHRSRLGRGGAVSVAAHAALISAAVITTATTRGIAIPEPIEVIQIKPYHPAEPVRQERQQPQSSNAAPSTFSVPSIVVPLVIPTDIQPIDLSAQATPTDFS